MPTSRLCFSCWIPDSTWASRNVAIIWFRDAFGAQCSAMILQRPEWLFLHSDIAALRAPLSVA